MLAFLWALFQPFAGDGGDPVRVTIPKEAGRGGDRATSSTSAGVVASATLFELRATLAGDRGDLKPGVYTLREDMTYGDVLDRLVAGPVAARSCQLTIPEGLSRREIAPLVGARGRARRLPARERRARR